MVVASRVVEVRWHPSAFDFAVCALGKLEGKLLPQVSFCNRAINNVAEHIRVSLNDGVGRSDDRFAVGPDADIYFAVPDDMEDSSKFGPIGALAGSV